VRIQNNTISLLFSILHQFLLPLFAERIKTGSFPYCWGKYAMSKNDSQENKQKTTTTTTRITKKLSVGLLASVIVLSSIAAAQLFVSDKNTAFAAVNCNETETVCSGGGATTISDDGTHRDTGSGSHSICTTDASSQTCTTSGGGGGGITSGSAEGAGGRSTCTTDLSTGEEICSFEKGGGSSTP
jgi:uncharacterized membrane protein YgcG